MFYTVGKCLQVWVDQVKAITRLSSPRPPVSWPPGMMTSGFPWLLTTPHDSWWYDPWSGMLFNWKKIHEHVWVMVLMVKERYSCARKDTSILPAVSRFAEFFCTYLKFCQNWFTIQKHSKNFSRGFILTRLRGLVFGLYPPATKSQSSSIIATHAWRLKMWENMFLIKYIGYLLDTFWQYLVVVIAGMSWNVTPSNVYSPSDLSSHVSLIQL